MVKQKKEMQDWIQKLAKCEKVLPDEEVDLLGRISGEYEKTLENASSDDEVDEDLEAECQRLNRILGLPADTYSLTRIKPNLPEYMKYGVRSGFTHMNMHKFSSFSRGLQGVAIAIAAYATTGLVKARCWNESVIDQILEDGDAYYCKSYKQLGCHDRKMLSILDLDESVIIQNTHQAHVIIGDPVYTGHYAPKSPTDMSVIKALELFFRIYNAGVLTSSSLNISIWKDNKYFNIFDAQPRKGNLLPDESRGTAKLILLPELAGVFFIILEKSNIMDEYFVLYPLKVGTPVPVKDDLEDVKSMKVEKRPSGYDIQGPRALIKGSFHCMHSKIPEALQGRSHQIVALSALVYSRLIHANKWSSPIIDLIFNQAHIYLVDLARVLGKKLDEDFQLTLDDILSDIYLGIYAAKIKIEGNIIPGDAKKGKGKGKTSIDSGLVEFFEGYQSGLLEVKNIFYALWKDGDKYYFLDPFACDEEGFRVNTEEEEDTKKYGKAVACVTMNTSVREVIETICENTGTTEKDPFFIHGVRVLYIKVLSENQVGKVVYREKKVNQRPVLLQSVQGGADIVDRCKIDVQLIPKPRENVDRTQNRECQFPELLNGVDDFMMRENAGEGELKVIKDLVGEMKKYIFKIVSPRCLILQASKNCLIDEYDKVFRGRQGLSISISVMVAAKFKRAYLWRSRDLDEVLDLGNQLHGFLVDWIRKGSPKLKERDEEEVEDAEEDEDEVEDQDQEQDEDEDEDEEEEEKEENEDDDEDNDDEEDNEENVKKYVKKTPSFIDIAMLPKKVKVGKNIVNLEYKRSIAQGEADPMVNLGEALERYFRNYNELILENKELMYGIWKEEGNYFLFQPYGSNDEGWRMYGPAALLVTDSINELVNLLHGILEFNDRKFILHFIYIRSIAEKYIAPVEIEVPEGVEMYQTMFLPLTDEDLLALKPIEQKDREELAEDEDKLDKEEEDEEEDDEDEEDEEEDDEEDEMEEEEEENEKGKQEMKEEILDVTQDILKDPLIEVPEQDRIQTPDQLNLFLLTTNVNLQEMINSEAKEATEYERLKYKHPPPYVSPSKKVLAMLLAAKNASLSVPSLVSCFSIDSKLAVKTDFPASDSLTAPVIDTSSVPEEAVKIIKLPPKKYVFSRILPVGFTPLRAINERYIHDDEVDQQKEEECRKKELSMRKSRVIEDTEIVTEPFDEERISPTIIPLGPVITTPTVEWKPKSCKGRTKRVDKLFDVGLHGEMTRKLVDNIEKIVMNLIFSEIKGKQQEEDLQSVPTDIQQSETSSQLEQSVTKNEEQEAKVLNSPRQSIGFIQTEENYSTIIGSECLDDRNTIRECQFKACFFAAILCLLTKIQINVSLFRKSLLDDIIIAAKQLYERAGILKYIVKKWTYECELFKVKFYIILEEQTHLDSEESKMDTILRPLEEYLKKHASGILVFENTSYAFWFTNNGYYLFDPYSCDEKGHASESGSACLYEFYKIDDFIQKIQEYCILNINNPYRIFNLRIKKIEWITDKKKGLKDKKILPRISSSSLSFLEDDKAELENVESQSLSLIELSDWIKNKRMKFPDFDASLRGFAAMKNFNASVCEVRVIENDITRPNRPAFKSSIPVTKKSKTLIELPRRKPFDRKFSEHSILAEPLDLCIMAWSCIHEPSRWGFRTIRGIVEASEDLAFDSILAAEDSTVSNMIDGLLTEFDIANYRFQAVFAPLHSGSLYSTEGWNLMISIKTLFDTPIYTGALISCGKAHVGIMKVASNFYFWYAVPQTPNFRIVASKNFGDFVKLIAFIIGETEDIDFQMRIITISYARKLDPDCSDTKGLHECNSAASLPQIFRKNDYDIEKIFHSALPSSKPLFILGTVSFEGFEEIKEPKLKRCYFAALLSVMVKRDILQSPFASMIDKVIQVAENLYRQFKELKYHTEHILKNVSVMNRIFDFRDVAFPLISIDQDNSEKERKEEIYVKLLEVLKNHFKKYDDGILHFSNCCYGFWYSPLTDGYYYLDPYQNNCKGRRVKGGAGCLGVFSSITQMVKAIIPNCINETTGFFIHRIHVESVNAIPYNKFQEDAMWIYLDYNWSINHTQDNSNHLKMKRKMKKAHDLSKQSNMKDNVTEKSWNYYTIEIPNLIYSLWGTLGTYNRRFGNRRGNNQLAICVALLAMQFLCHPSQWGPAILDSAVICGDCYYTESLKSLSKGCKYSNNFKLQTYFKVFPHVWKIDYGVERCGILYGGKGRPSLAALLKCTLDDHPNILMRCGNITLAVFVTVDGFYVADPCWTGPPLFLRHHGAIYALRCRNINTLIYVIVKMLNTNTRCEFFITPVSFIFKQESCVDTNTHQKDQKDRKDLKKERTKKILCDSPALSYPGVARGPNVRVAGGIVVPNEDSYSTYQQKLALGSKKGKNLEHPSISCPLPNLNADYLRNIMLSTTWHKNTGHSKPKIGQNNSGKNKIMQANENAFKRCNNYPKTVDFLEDKYVRKFESGKRTKESISKPLDCLPPRKFILTKSKKEFKKKIKQIGKMELPKYNEAQKSVRNLPNVFDDLMQNLSVEETEELTMADVL